MGLDRKGTFTGPFFRHDERIATGLKGRMQPFAKGANDGITSFGGQVLTVRDIVSAKGTGDVRAAIDAKLRRFPGWTEAELLRVSTVSVQNQIAIEYYRGLYQFLYHWSDQKYREKFLAFVRMDLSGEVDAENPVPAFEKAFGLDEAGWKRLEGDFTAYQS
jgi:hypothetical protein